jgi:hypothetical protein
MDINGSITLEDLVRSAPYVTATYPEPPLRWDSGYTADHRRSFLLGTPQNTATLHEALNGHLIVEETLKTNVDDAAHDERPPLS